MLSLASLWGDKIGSRATSVEPHVEIHDDGGLCISNTTGGKGMGGFEKIRTSEDNNKYLMSSQCVPDPVVGALLIWYNI